MKYLAFCIDTSSIENHKVVKGFFVRGQRRSDYNWPLLGEFPGLEEAKAFIRSMVTDPVRQSVHGPDGYGIKL